MNYEKLKRLLEELTDIVQKERQVILGFVFASLLVKCIFLYLDYHYSKSIIDLTVVHDSEYDRGIVTADSLMNGNSYTEHRLFYFHPETVGLEELLKLGFSEKTAHIFINYRNKGGRFYSREDVKKIYGVSDDLYHKIEPYIIIESSEKKQFKQDKFYSNSNSPKIIDINRATVEEWKSLPCIGDFFANKFVNMRKGIGAYLSIEQIQMTYNFPDSSFQKIKPFLRISPMPIKKININESSEAEIRAYPYILKWQAEEILKHRPIYGLEDLYELNSFRDKAKYKWIENYFEF